MEDILLPAMYDSAGCGCDPFELEDTKSDREHRVYWLDDEIDDSSLGVVKYILRCNASDKGKPAEERQPIKILINNIGGDVSVMWSIIKAIEVSTTPVYTIVYCNALSAAAHILCAGHKRFAMPGSTILIHSGSISLSGDVEKAESARKYMNTVSDAIDKHLITHSTVNMKTLKKKGAADWYISPEEALELHIVDSIIDNLDDVL